MINGAIRQPLPITFINLVIYLIADSLCIFAVTIVSHNKYIKFMITLHLHLVFSVPDGLQPSFVKLVNALSNVLGMELLDLNYFEGNKDPTFERFGLK